jgi:hypothetical protein
MDMEDMLPWPPLTTSPLETALWINALADRTPKGELLRPGLGDLVVHLLRSWEPRTKA